MIDLSDGLSTDLSHLCEESRVGALVHADSLPTIDSSPESLAYALHGGEDYELLFTAPRNRRVPKKIAGVTVTEIGEILPSRRSQMWLESEGLRVPLKPKGWEHFRKVDGALDGQSGAISASFAEVESRKPLLDWTFRVSESTMQLT